MKPTLPVIVLLLGALLASATSQAQQSASKRTFLKLTEVQSLWEEDRYDDALAELEELIANVRDKPYDYALANQYLAHTSILADDAPRARRALEDALATPELPTQLQAELKLFYGQVVLGDEDYDIAVRVLEEWLEQTEAQILPQQVFYVAYANYRTGNLARAEPLIKRAIDGSKSRNENWDRLYYQILFEQQKFAAAEIVLYDLLSAHTDSDTYWRLLANHYMQVEESRQALAALLLGHLQQALTKATDLEHIISLYGYVDLPEKAARMLAQYMEDETLPADEETLRRLGDLWLLARERDRAKDVLQRAAAVAPDGRTYQLLGGIYFEDEDWQQAYEMFLQALDFGGLEEPDRVQMLAGISALRAGLEAEAERALREAARSDEFRDEAEQLLDKLDGA